MAEGSRVALYARVSTLQQSADMQIEDMRRLAEQRGWTIVDEYVDLGQSGAKSKRPELDRMLGDAHRGQFDVVLVWKFDRFARSARHLLQALESLRELNVAFVSVRDQIDTSTAMGKLVFTMIAAIAELERDIIRERVAAGIEHARVHGTKSGRPHGRPWRELDEDRIRRYLDQGMSTRAIAKKMQVPQTTMIRRIRKLKKGKKGESSTE